MFRCGHLNSRLGDVESFQPKKSLGRKSMGHFRKTCFSNIMVISLLVCVENPFRKWITFKFGWEIWRFFSQCYLWDMASGSFCILVCYRLFTVTPPKRKKDPKNDGPSKAGISELPGFHLQVVCFRGCMFAFVSLWFCLFICVPVSGTAI